MQTHPYLTRKGVEAHGLRQDRRGNLLVPMRDIDGRLWGLQTITPDGGKLFMRGGRKQGTHALLGELQPGAPVVIAEGFATAATMREATGLAVVAAFDSGNLLDVARALPRARSAAADHHRGRQRPPPAAPGAAAAERRAGEGDGGGRGGRRHRADAPLRAGRQGHGLERLRRPSTARRLFGPRFRPNCARTGSSYRHRSRAADDNPGRPRCGATAHDRLPGRKAE